MKRYFEKAFSLSVLLWLCFVGGCVPKAETDVGEARQIISQDVEPMVRLAWRPDGRTLVTSSRTGNVHEWDIAQDGHFEGERYLHPSLTWDTVASDISWSADGKQLAV